MTLNEARLAAAQVPAHLVNNNCVQDGQYRLREALALAERFYGSDDPAPAYVRKAVADLRSWFEPTAVSLR